MQAKGYVWRPVPPQAAVDLRARLTEQNLEALRERLDDGASRLQEEVRSLSAAVETATHANQAALSELGDQLRASQVDGYETALLAVWCLAAGTMLAAFA